jgi:hypothetical protein
MPAAICLIRGSGSPSCLADATLTKRLVKAGKVAHFSGLSPYQCRPWLPKYSRAVISDTPNCKLPLIDQLRDFNVIRSSTMTASGVYEGFQRR